MPHARPREVAEGDRARWREVASLCRCEEERATRLDSTRLTPRTRPTGGQRAMGGGRRSAVGGRRRWPSGAGAGAGVAALGRWGIKVEACYEPRACTPLYEPQAADHAADPTAQRRAGRERVWCARLVPFCGRCANARPHESVQTKKRVVLCLYTKLAPRAAHRPAARTRTPVVAPPRPVMVSWTWPRGGLGLAVHGEGWPPRGVCGWPRRPQKKTRRRRKGAFVERTHVAAEQSGCHELLSMVLMVGE